MRADDGCRSLLASVVLIFRFFVVVLILFVRFKVDITGDDFGVFVGCKMADDHLFSNDSYSSGDSICECGEIVELFTLPTSTNDLSQAREFGCKLFI